MSDSKERHTIEIIRGTDARSTGDGPEHMYIIIVKDKHGKEILSHNSVGSRSMVGTLFWLAKRVGSRIDERIESSLQLLNTL